MAVVSFNGINKRIVVQFDVGESDVVLDVIDVYSAWKRWVRTDNNGKFLQAFSSVGGEPTGNNERLGQAFFILNGWIFAPQTTVQLSSLKIKGDLFPQPENNPVLTIAQIQAGYSLLCNLRTSTLPVLMVTDGGGGSGDAPTVDEIAAKMERTGGPIDKTLKNSNLIPGMV